MDNFKQFLESNAAFRAQHQQQSEASQSTQQNGNAQDSALPSTEMAIGIALSNVFSTLQAGAKPPEDWLAEQIEIEVRLGMIVQGSRRLHARSEKNNAQYGTGRDFREQLHANFQAGIDETFARQLRHRLQTSTKEFYGIVQPTEIVYCSSNNTTTSGGSGNKRYLLIEDNENEGKKVFKEEEKSRMLDIQLAMLPYDYDLRVCGAKEKTSEGEITVMNGNNYTTLGEPFHCDRIRTKKRITFYRKNQARLWRIDFTEVITTPLQTNDQDDNTTNNNNNNSSKSGEVEYELEFEMEQNVKMEWINEKNPELIQAMLRELINSLMSLIKMLIPSQANHAGIKFEKTDLISGQQAFNSVKYLVVTEMNTRIKENTTAGKLEFLGSMPINLYRKSFKNVQNMDYFLTEKTDGVRYLLYTIQDANLGFQSILCNRDCQLSYFPGGDKIAQLLRTGCVFDGEIVFNITLNRYVFLVFDVLMIDFESLTKAPFEERLYQLETYLTDDTLQELAEAIDESVPSNKGLILRRKRYFRKNEISELIDSFEVDSHTASGSGSGERYFKGADGKKSHLTDGIIFQPATLPYECGRCYDLFKWKWSDMRSVDLGVAIIYHPQKIDDGDTRNDHRLQSNYQEITNQNIHLWCAKGANERIDCTKRGENNVGLGKFDTFRLLSEYHHRRTHIEKTRPIIAEVCYDTHIGMWSYVKIREDKTSPNAIDAVMGVFTEQAEAIGIEELEFSLLANERGEEQNFGDLLEKCKQEIIKLQRNKRRRTEG